MSKRKIVFFGNERLVSGLTSTDTPILKALIASEYEVVAVVANNAGTKSRTTKPLEVAELAQLNTIPVHLPAHPMDIADELRAYGADAGVLVAYGRIVPQALIDLFPFGIINVHPSLLPKYRGPSPIESTIANGDESTGVSIMSLSRKMDAGPVYHQVEVKLSADETAPSLSKKLAHLAATELTATLPKIFDGSLTATAQNDADATYCQLISKQDGRLDPSVHTAAQAERLVRAYKAFPKTRLSVHGYDVIVTASHVVQSVDSPLHITFADGAVLSVDELTAPSGKSMTAGAFIQGYLK